MGDGVPKTGCGWAMVSGNGSGWVETGCWCAKRVLVGRYGCWRFDMGAGRSEMGGAGLRRAAGGQHLAVTHGLGPKRVLLGLVSQRMGQNKKRRT
jgi:hypothetical protein